MPDIRFVISTIILMLATMNLTSCRSFLLEGDSSPLNSKVITVTVPSETPRPPVKPVKTPEPESSKIQAQPEVRVHEKLLPQEIPPQDDRFKIPLEPSSPKASHTRMPAAAREPAIRDADTTLRNHLIREDTTWKGTVLVTGYVIVSPQATLRISPGTTVRFSMDKDSSAKPLFLIQGRLIATGTVDKPIIFASNYLDSAKADWNGLVFLSSEKKNMLEHARIEGALNAVDARFSQLSIKNLSISTSERAVNFRDGSYQVHGIKIAKCSVGIELHYGELDLKDAVFSNNAVSMIISRSSLVASSVTESKSDTGIVMHDGRIRLSNAEFASNRVGIDISGTEGQISLSRFKSNETGIFLRKGTRIKITGSVFSGNRLAGVRSEDISSVLYGNSFFDNALAVLHDGQDELVAVQNWWGSSKNTDVAKQVRSTHEKGVVLTEPWLAEKPVSLP